VKEPNKFHTMKLR